MRRREFMRLLGGAAAAWPFTALAEQGKVARIGVLLLGYPEIADLIQRNLKTKN